MSQASLVNPRKEVVSRKIEELLGKGPKFCLNVKLSRLDVLSSIQTVAKMVSQDEKAALVDQAVGRVVRIMGKDYPTERRSFREVRAVKNELKGRLLDLIRTDKSGKFVILPRSIYQKKTKKALDNLLFSF